jgi:hypothetical protein
MPHPLPAPVAQGTRWSRHRIVQRGVASAVTLAVLLGICVITTVPLPWLGEIAGIGAELPIAGPDCWVRSLICLMTDPGSLVLRGVRALALFGVIGTVPAAADLLWAIRTRAGARSIIGSALLLIVLGGIAWATLSFHVLTPGTGS